MTISSTSSRVVYSGDGATSSFGFAFYVSDQADLVVTWTDSAGNQTVIAPGSAPAGYQISTPAVPAPGWPAGGTITYNPGSPIAPGTTLTIQRIVAGTQPTTLSNQGAFWPQVIEKALDRVVTIVQGFIDQANRSLQAPATDPVTLNPLPTAAARQNTVLGFDNNGQPYAAVITGSLVAVNGWLVSNFLGAASSAAAACSALGAFFLGGNNTASGSNSFTGTNDFTAGRIKVPTRSPGDSGSDAASTNFVAATLTTQIGGSVPRGWLGGLAIANDGGSPNSVLDIAAGACADGTNTAMIALGAFTKSTGGSFVAGSGNNGLGQGLSLAASTWYHVFAALVNAIPDVFFDTSPTAANKPAGTGAFRRIGSFRTDGSAHIIAFAQNGDEFLWSTPTLDMNGTTPGTSASLATLNVPTGVKVNALIQGVAFGQTGGNAVLFSAPDTTDTAPANPGICTFLCNSGAYAAFSASIRTDTSGRIRQRSTSTTSLLVYTTTVGWIDRRGRDA
jgi:hypothetical protein